MKNGCMRIFTLLFITLIVVPSSARAADVLPGGTSNWGDVVIGNMTPEPMVSTADVTVYVRASCFGTNLRSVSNPIAPNSTITARFILGPEQVQLSFQGWQVGPVYLNAIKIKKLYKYSIDAGGNISKSAVNSQNLRVGVTQGGVAGGQYMANPGPVSANVGIHESSTGEVIHVNIAMPGQNGFCGGYYSPLMAFFENEKIPQFTGKSKFPLNPSGLASWWPEAGSQGAFLVMDRNGDGKISESNELFGPQDDSFKNGFEHLRGLDSNKDNVIDAKDRRFGALMLWRDANADGVSQAKELVSASSKGIVSISLKYSDNRTSPIADRAELREEAVFTYRGSDGRIKKGRMIDVWFSPAPEAPQSLASN
jgi:hypothetical protein